MTPDLWKQIYNWALVPLIGGGLLMIATMIWRKQYKWGFFFSGVFVSVLIFEALGVLENGKTISAQYGQWIVDDPVWAFVALFFMVVWMVALVAHLFAGGFRKKR